MFEVKIRDGPARTGIYIEGELNLETPFAADSEYIRNLIPGLGKSRHSNVPLFAGDEFAEKYLADPEGAVAVHPASENRAESGDVVLVSNWHTVIENPVYYSKWIMQMKRNNPCDTLWYAPASALPSNAATLISSGFDLFDYTAVDLKTATGIFCTSDGEYPADEWLASGVCTCAGCLKGDLKLHNRLTLQAEISVVKNHIKAGTLREHLEKRCRNSAWQVSVLRLSDSEYKFAEGSIPVVRSITLAANSGESLKRPEVVRFEKRVIERFVPKRSDVAVLLPCSARKPYSQSQSHKKYQNAIQNRAHEIIITSPLGVVPRELERIYPAGHYDVPVTGYWDGEERKIIGSLIERYFAKNHYDRIILHLDGDALDIAKDSFERLGMDYEVTVADDRPTSYDSLKKLDEALSGERKKRPDVISGTINWQFGKDVDTSGLMIKGRFGREKVLKGKTQFFSIDNDTGLFRPTFNGWQLLGGIYRVRIDNFIPQGDILAPGVISCGPEIRPGDEVLVSGESALATGRAVMGPAEMENSRRGVAVRVRKVKKLNE
ncbi:archaeosine synthase subunit alpha [Methanoplanus limicola]|uniref:tRNA-archaeosine synthase n=1 Tax=Methanoplanus limicola DSM 2279 TaxID=937775 RepID=H1Z4A0_9EURY|nr:archaeosine synthase subunit alpha [Methanoplanus limicola]EHQ36648.1 tRNA-archaeosine synthase [Methanoplanus limicola DSM 2279]